ncbi:MAG: cytochrome b/b6 domain-containing protein [Sphingosinicella sp.]|uniref:cytochrome b/b6 domain-containing protein n=1 Tax=Sphingosinicella sp. TaxID=1917971 RepID=UPI0040378C71
MEPDPPESATAEAAPPLVKRHRLSTRIWHWVNALTVFVMLMSGLMIFNAHPRLYWGEYGANQDHAWLEIGSAPDRGFLRIGSFRIGTTGLLGYRVTDRGIERRAFPGWATIPSTYDLAGGRRWHLAFAWVLAIGLIAFWIASLVNRHAQRDLAPRRSDLSPRRIWHEIRQHARLRFPTGEAALRYNSLQKLSYVAVIFVLLPLVILTGLTMSPGMNAAWPWLLDLFGGRQSARSIHFIVAVLLVAFILVHLVRVLLAGPLNELRAMITGWYRVPRDREVKP